MYQFIHQSSTSLQQALRAWTLPVGVCVCVRSCGQWEGKCGAVEGLVRCTAPNSLTHLLAFVGAIGRNVIEHSDRVEEAERKRSEASRKCPCRPWQDEETWRLPAMEMDNLQDFFCPWWVCFCCVGEKFFSLWEMRDCVVLLRFGPDLVILWTRLDT